MNFNNNHNNQDFSIQHFLDLINDMGSSISNEGSSQQSDTNNNFCQDNEYKIYIKQLMDQARQLGNAFGFDVDVSAYLDGRNTGHTNDKKITLKIDHNGDKRRISKYSSELSTYHQALNIIKDILNLSVDNSDLTLTYIDEEGDSIKVTSNDEWRECLSYHANSIVKVFIKIQSRYRIMPLRANNIPNITHRSVKLLPQMIPNHRIQMNAQSDSYMSFHLKGMEMMEQGRYEDAIDFFTKQTEIKRGSPIPLYNIGCAYARLGKANIACRYLHLAIRNGYRDLEHLERDEDLESIRETGMYTSVIKRLESLIGRQNRSQQRFRRCQMRNINRNIRRWHGFQRRIMRLFDKNTSDSLNTALNLLNKQMELCSEEESLSCITLYNMACVYSLQGELTKAIEHLNKSIEKGYDKVNHIISDPDLNNIKEMEEFKAIIRRLKGETESEETNVETENEETNVETENEETNVETENEETNVETEEVFENKVESENSSQSEEYEEDEVELIYDDTVETKEPETQDPEINSEETEQDEQDPILEEPDFKANMEALLAMGFERDVVINALKVSNNDAITAIDLIIHQA